MGSLDGLSLLRRPLPLLVTSLVFSGVFCSSSGASTLCDVSCCSVLPSCDNARLVTCDCPHIDAMTLRKGDIPETVRAVNILNIKHVTIDKHAINVLHSLTNFTLIGIDKLEIKQDGMASQNQSKLRSVTIQNVGSLQVESKAFSGVWQPKTSIRMHRIGGLYVESNALDYQVTELGPSVSLQHVGMLNLEPNGFAASIFELDVYNVTMDVCHDGSFGGNTLNTELNNMTIAEARARCFYGLNDVATFNLRSLKIQTVHPQAFSGNMRELIIKDSQFTTIHERGFDIHVTSMELSTSYISELHSKGLSVLASDTLRLDTVRVESLRRNALAGLQMVRNKDEFDQPLVIRKLELIETENGSLTFSECTKVRLTDVDLMAPWPRICPTEKWTQALSGGGVSGQLTPAQYQLFFQLFQRRICFEDGWRKFPISVESPHCSVRIGGGVSNQRDGDASLDDGEDNALRGDTEVASSKDTSAEDNVSHEDRDDDLSKSENRNQRSGTDGTGSTSSASSPRGSSSARGSSGAGAASRTPDALPTDAMNFSDNNEGRTDDGPRRSNKQVGEIADGPATASGGVQHVDQHQLLLCLALGVAITLSVVLAVVLLLMMMTRRHRSQTPANDQPSTLETLLEALACRLTDRHGGGAGLTGTEDDHEKKSDGSRVQTGNRGGSFYSSEAPFADCHHYEKIGRGLLLPPPSPTGNDLLLLPQPTRGDLLLPPSHPTKGGLLLPLSVASGPSRVNQPIF